MRIKLFLMYILFIIVSITFIIQICIASDMDKWKVQINIYSGRINPEYQLDENEIIVFKNMLGTNMEQSVRVVDDNKDKHEGREKQYGQYIGNSFYKVIRITVTSDIKEYIELYEISGKYLRIYNDEGNSSKLYKLKNKDIEEYLINLAFQKGAINEREDKIIKNDIQKRDKRDKDK